VTVDTLWQAEVPVLAGVKACLQAGVSVPGGTLRVDTSVVDGELTSPMCLARSGGPSWPVDSMRGTSDVAVVRVVVTCIGASVELATQLRAKAARALVGRNPATGAHWTALTAAGLVVVRRELSDVLPGVTEGGGWANAVLPVGFQVQPAS
jgi:hypothetical protein